MLRKIFSLKKIGALVLIFSIIGLSAVGCGRKENSIGDASSQAAQQASTQVQGKANNSNSQNTKGNAGNSAVSDKTDEAMQATSNALDKLDNTLNGLDDSSNINTTESLINSIN